MKNKIEIKGDIELPIRFNLLQKIKIMFFSKVILVGKNITIKIKLGEKK